MIDVDNFHYMKIGLALPGKIRSWSYGGVKKPGTVNYRTSKPEKDGLFCERVFGPTEDWECSCGRYKRVRYKGMVYDRCDVEVTKSKVCRERMGHTELAASASHIRYFKGIPSHMGLLLDISPKSLEEVIYFVSYVAVDPDPTGLKKKSLLSGAEFKEYYDRYQDQFIAKVGAGGIKDLLEGIDLDEELKVLRNELEPATGQRLTRAIKRLKVAESFRNPGDNPSWMILGVLPIIPPEIRPVVQLNGGRFTISDLNDLYHRVIDRNNRLKRLLDLDAPGIIVQNEKRMLQEAVNALIDNDCHGHPVTGLGNRPLRSLSRMLKDEQGRFRQNSLGKRVDYSGCLVIAIGPDLKMYQCGLPKEMALELFKSFVMKELIQCEIATSIKNAKNKIERMDDEVWDILEGVIREHPVLLNRAPTLHRLDIQAFEPTLVEGHAIHLHPLVTTAYNADFDGDQMAVYVPLSKEAQAEARMLMLAAQNILSPRDDKPAVTPSQDMILGNYYLILERKDAVDTGIISNNTDEVLKAYTNDYVHLHTRAGLHARSLSSPTFTEEQNNRILATSAGKVIFNEIIPDSFAYINEPTQKNLEDKTPDKCFASPTQLGEGGLKAYFGEQELTAPFNEKFLGNIIAKVFSRFSITDISMMLDRMKGLEFRFSSKAGIAVGVSDIIVPPGKQQILDEHEKLVERVSKQFNRGLITEDERYNTIVEIWTSAKDQIQGELMQSLEKINPIFTMSNSGVRGNTSNSTQLAGVCGLMAAPSGKITELPITSSFHGDLTALEYFISAHGTRKGLTDTALKTTDPGYLTHRLVDVAQDVIVHEKDYGTGRGLLVSDIKEGAEMIEPFVEHIEGRYSKGTIRHPETDEITIRPNGLVTPEIAKKITDAGIEKVYIRSTFTCNTRHGVHKKYYGKNLTTSEKVEVGEAAGIITAQSIGESGTQLTMRTFHTGGITRSDITQGFPRTQEVFKARNPKGQTVITEIEGVVEDIKLAKDRRQGIVVKGVNETRSYLTSGTSRIKVEVGQSVERGEVLTEGSIEPKSFLAVAGLSATESYLLEEAQKVCRMQGVEINDKHVEVTVGRMLCKVRIIEVGDTKLLPGSLVDIRNFTGANGEALEERRRPVIAKPVLLGITRASLEVESFSSTASFQGTTRVLTDVAVKDKRDDLLGLKENAVIGKFIPAGTSMRRYGDVKYDKVGTPVAETGEAEVTK